MFIMKNDLCCSRLLVKEVYQKVITMQLERDSFKD